MSLEAIHAQGFQQHQKAWDAAMKQHQQGTPQLALPYTVGGIPRDTWEQLKEATRIAVLKDLGIL